MTRTLLVIAGLVVATALVLGPGRQLLPGAFLMSPSTTSLQAGQTTRPAAQDHTTTTPKKAPTVAAIPDGNTRLVVSARPQADAAQGYVLTAVLRTTDGKAVGSAPVRFYESVDLFGARGMLIGTASTDGGGAAALSYLPAVVGPHEIVARTLAEGQLNAAIGRFTFEASVSAPAYHDEPKPLASFLDRVPYAVGLVVLSVWSLIAFALFATARGVIGGARSSTRKGETA